MPTKSLDQESLEVHASGRPGKLEITPTKPMATQRDLSLAYSPGVAAPCLKIHQNPDTAYDYTTKGNSVAVISNGTAVLGLGDLGALASKPVMEGKAVLFKRFADVDGVDLEISTADVDAFVNCVRYLGASFGGVNLEDIKAPDCFVIEERLRDLLDIPVFHDDQHGTAIIAAAGLINALHLTGRSMRDTKMVINGAGAAAIACADLFKKMGFAAANVTMCDSKGVIYRGRTAGLNQWKSAHAIATEARSLADAMVGADIFFGLSVKGAVTRDMVRSMADKPIIFALANPDPEITPEDVSAVRDDAIVATGRSDYPNQVNNVLGFPYIFRGALDVRARTINDEMKIAAAQCLADLAREDVPDEVDTIYAGSRLEYGPGYIIPVPFDQRLFSSVPVAVARAAIETGVARHPIADLEAYRRSLRARLDPTVESLEAAFAQVRGSGKRVVFAEGEEERSIKAALSLRNEGFGMPILVGREDEIRRQLVTLGTSDHSGLEIQNAKICGRRLEFIDFLYRRLQRKGAMERDCARMVNQNRNVFAACMLACDQADAMVTGLTRTFTVAYEDVCRVIDPKPGHLVFGLSVLIYRGRTIFIADTTVIERPEPDQLLDIAIQSAARARQLGHSPRVAFLSFSNFGRPSRPLTERCRAAVKLMDAAVETGLVDFEYEGEMTAEVALDKDLMDRLYPFSRLSGPANVLIMPALHAANISAKMLQKVAGGTLLDPLLIGLERPVQIVPLGTTVSELVTVAALAAHDAMTA